jgi:hypothetical protein
LLSRFSCADDWWIVGSEEKSARRAISKRHTDRDFPARRDIGE